MQQRKNIVHKRQWLPDYYARTTADIDFDWLHQQGLRACLIDLDDTIVLHGRLDVEPGTAARLRSQPLDLYIATNRPAFKNVSTMAKQIGAKGVLQPNGIAAKPSRRYYRRALELTGYQPGQMCMIGDHLLQDVWGANRAGFITIAVGKLGRPPLLHQPIALLERFYYWLIRPFYQPSTPSQ